MAIHIDQVFNIAERFARNVGDFFARQGHRGDQLIQNVLNALQRAGFGRPAPAALVQGPRLNPGQVQQIARRTVRQVLTQEIVAHEIY